MRRKRRWPTRGVTITLECRHVVHSILANEKHFAGIRTGGLGLGGLDGLEHRLHEIDEVLRAGPFEGLEYDMSSRTKPSGTDLKDKLAQSDGAIVIGIAAACRGRCHVAENDIEWQMWVDATLFKLSFIQRGGISVDDVDVVLIKPGSNGLKIDPDDEAAGPDSTRGHLHPAPGCGTQIQNSCPATQNLPFVIDLRQLERRT